MANILLISDNKEEVINIQYACNLDIYELSFHLAKSFKKGIKLLNPEKHNLVIIDEDLPDFNSDSLQKVLSNFSNFKVLILTEKKELVKNKAGQIENKNIHYFSKKSSSAKLTKQILDLSIEGAYHQEIKSYSPKDENGLYSREVFFQLCEHQLIFAKRYNYQLELLMSHIKISHQTHVIQDYDELNYMFQIITKDIKSKFRQSDIIGRLNNFDIGILVNQTEEGCLSLLMNRVKDRINEFNRESREAYQADIISGHALYKPDKNQSLECLLKEAKINFMFNAI